MEWVVHLIVCWLLQNRASRSGCVTKTVRCENCTLTYEYEMQRSVTRRGEAKREALGREAEWRLRKQLAQECDPVPCPACGWYQQHMIEQVRRQALRHVPGWVIPLAIPTAVSIAFALLSALLARMRGPVGASAEILIGIPGAIGALILVLFLGHRMYRRIAYNPNRKRWKNENACQ